MKVYELRNFFFVHMCSCRFFLYILNIYMYSFLLVHPFLSGLFLFCIVGNIIFLPRRTPDQSFVSSLRFMDKSDTMGQRWETSSICLQNMREFVRA